MAKQRPSLGVSAAPLTTYVASVAPAVELYDQQSVNLALQFSEAFKDLSLTAAQFAGTMKREQNEQELLAGADMVNRSQKSYMALVESGEIKPSENPWMAIGAQQASGSLEGMKARAHFMSTYEKAKAEDPRFLDGQDGFNALAAQYTANVNKSMGNAAYMSRAFYENFNPFISSMAVKHEEAVVENRKEKILTGVGAEVAKVLSDFSSADPVVKNTAVGAFQEAIDQYGRMGIGYEAVNKAVVDNMAAVMATTDNVELAERLFAEIKTGTGYLKDTEYAKAVLGASRAKIEANRNRLTTEEANSYYAASTDIIGKVVSGKMTKEQAVEWLNGYASGPDRKISVSADELESKRRGMLNEIDRGLADASRRQRQEADDQVINYIVSNVERVPAGSTEDEWYGQAKDSMESLMSRMPSLTPADKLAYRDEFDRRWEKSTAIREQNRLIEGQRLFWYGDNTIDNPGIIPQTTAQAVAWVRGESGDLPDFIDIRQNYESYLATQGLNPEDPKAKTAMRNAYTKLDVEVLGRIEQTLASQFPGGLKELPTDNISVREQKGNARASLIFMRMMMGSTFEDSRAANKAAQIVVQNLNPTVEAQVNYELVDVIKAAAIARQNNLPNVLAVNLDSPNGKALAASLDWMATEVQRGANPLDAIRDGSQRLRMGTYGQGVDWTNPLMWTDFFRNATDAQAYADEASSMFADLGLSDSDGIRYAVAQMRTTSFDSLGKTQFKPDEAFKAARAEFEQSHMVVRGSAVAKRDFPYQDPEFVETWLDINFPDNPRATLVVVDIDGRGNRTYAVREDGRSVEGSRPLTAADFTKAWSSGDLIRKSAERRAAKREEARNVAERYMRMLEEPNRAEALRRWERRNP